MKKLKSHDKTTLKNQNSHAKNQNNRKSTDQRSGRLRDPLFVLLRVSNAVAAYQESPKLGCMLTAHDYIEFMAANEDF